MAGEVDQVGKEALECVLMYAMFAGKNVRAQRDRLVQLRRPLPQRSPGDEGAAGVQEVAFGLHKVYSVGLYKGTGYLADCLETAADGGKSCFVETAAEKGDRASFSIPAFTVIPDEQLYGVLLTQRPPPCPTTQAQAFAHIESAYCAAILPLLHHLPRCIELLVGVRPAPVNRRPNGGMIGYSDNPVDAAYEHLIKRLEDGSPDPDPAPAAAAASDRPPQVKSSVDLDQALCYLYRTCSLTTLAVKHLDVAVAFISSLLDPDEVGKISKWTDERVYISEDGPYDQSDSNSD